MATVVSLENNWIRLSPVRGEGRTAGQSSRLLDVGGPSSRSTFHGLFLAKDVTSSITSAVATGVSTKQHSQVAGYDPRSVVETGGPAFTGDQALMPKQAAVASSWADPNKSSQMIPGLLSIDALI